MPGPYRGELREDVVAVARRRESGVTIKQIATDFGVGEETLQNWLRQADVEEGNPSRSDRGRGRRDGESCAAVTVSSSRRTKSSGKRRHICRRQT